MSADEELKQALQKYDEGTKKKLAKAIMRFTEEEGSVSSHMRYVRWLKITCPVALFICGPIFVLLLNELYKGSLMPLVFALSVIPIILVSVVAAIVYQVKLAPE